MSRIHAAHARIPSLGIAAGRAAAAIAIALCVSAAPARAQDRTSLTADAESPAIGRDRARLAALGLDLATLEQAEDAALLWRAVRELVLPGKVSEPTQRSILRRVWLADREIARGSQVDSATR